MKVPEKLLVVLCLSFVFDGHTQEPKFTDVSISSGINALGRSHGVSIADYNNDGYDDIYVVKQSGPNLLFRNKGDMTFVQVAKEAGVDHPGDTFAACWGDLDNDGFVDLYLGNRGHGNLLFKNNGDGTFTDITDNARVGVMNTPNSINMADIDNDGFLDIYLSHPREENIMFRNNGDMTFTDVTWTSGASDTRFSMGSVFFDYDFDNDMDLYLVHDADEPNILYRNNGDGTFTDVSDQAGVAYEGNGMGVDFGDINGDGLLDIYITNLWENTLYRNNGDGTFTDLSLSAKVDDNGMGWGITWLDYNNDGMHDIYVANQSNFTPYPNVLYRNLGDETFEIVSENTPLYSMNSGFGLACADFNNDGAMDLFVANENINHHDELFRNEEDENDWIMVKLIGNESNKSAIGARVEIEYNGTVQNDIVTAGSSYCSQNSFKLHFGLGVLFQVDKMTVYWPSGRVEVFQGLAVNTLYTVTEGIHITPDPESIITSINDRTTINELPGIYPNPVSSYLNFRVIDAAQYTFKLMDLQSKVLLTGRIDKTHKMINLNDLKEGLYLVELIGSSGKSGYYKVIKQ